jgi:hypothetical protein
MKKTLIIALLACASIAQAQFPKCNIWFTSSDTVSPGDSAWVDIKFADSYPNSMTDTAKILIAGTSYQLLLFQDTYYNLMSYPTHQVGSDVVVRISFVIPATATPGPANYKAKSNGMAVYVKGLSTSITEAVLNKGKTIIHSEMYDIEGRDLRLYQPKGIIYFKRDFYSDGTVETKKYYLQHP